MDERTSETDYRLLRRDCAALGVPGGQPAMLSAGAQARVTQRLGGSITVLSGGNLYRIDERDADALGLEPSPAVSAVVAGGLDAADIEQAAWAQLATCYDPEIPIDIVSLGLVYACAVEALADGRYRIDVSMTLTAPGCGMGSLLADEARAKLLAIPGVEQAQVKLVWNPPWNWDRLSEAARLDLGMP